MKRCLSLLLATISMLVFLTACGKEEPYQGSFRMSLQCETETDIKEVVFHLATDDGKIFLGGGFTAPYRTTADMVPLSLGETYHVNISTLDYLTGIANQLNFHGIWAIFEINQKECGRVWISEEQLQGGTVQTMLMPDGHVQELPSAA